MPLRGRLLRLQVPRKKTLIESLTLGGAEGHRPSPTNNPATSGSISNFHSESFPASRSSLFSRIAPQQLDVDIQNPTHIQPPWATRTAQRTLPPRPMGPPTPARMAYVSARVLSSYRRPATPPKTFTCCDTDCAVCNSRTPTSGPTHTSPWATRFPMSAGSRSSSRRCAVRNWQQWHPLDPTADSLAEGEQFANAYFDTETKIKMSVPVPTHTLTSP